MFLLYIYIALIFALVVLILLQSPSSDSLSSFSSAHQNLNSFVVRRSTSTFISRVTAVVAGCFLVSTLILAGIKAREFNRNSLSGSSLSANDSSRSLDSSTNVPLNS